MSMTIGKHARRVLNKKADAVHSAHNLVVKIGTDADHIAICGKADRPLGVCADAPDVAEYPATVEQFTGPDTVVAVAAGAIAVGDEVYTAANGKVANATTSSTGATYKVGRALSAAAAADEEVEIEGCYPVSVTL